MPTTWVKWSKREDSLLEEWSGVYSPEQMIEMLRSIGSDRTIAALSKRMHILGMSTHRELNNFSAQGVAKMTGVSLNTVLRWIDRGYLKAKRRTSLRVETPKRAEYLISRENLVTLLVSPPTGLRKSRIKKIDPEVIKYLSEGNNENNYSLATLG